MRGYKDVKLTKELPEHTKLELISKFTRWYDDTDQDEQKYSREFLYVVRSIMDNSIPIRCKYLALEEVMDELSEALPEEIQAEIVGK